LVFYIIPVLADSPDGETSKTGHIYSKQIAKQ
jgi:hypothetical protein